MRRAHPLCLPTFFWLGHRTMVVTLQKAIHHSKVSNAVLFCWWGVAIKGEGAQFLGVRQKRRTVPWHTVVHHLRWCIGGTLIRLAQVCVCHKG